MNVRSVNFTRALVAVALGSMGLVMVPVDATASPLHSLSDAHGGVPTYAVTQLLLGSSLSHTFTTAASTTPSTESLSAPDDIAQLGDVLFTGFQNGVGPNGEASTSGNLDSTIVEFTLRGHVLGQWDVAGRVEGLVADPQSHGIIATANEDSNSSLFVVTPDAPRASQISHYSYGAPLTHGGGTDSIAIVHGQILISASNPGTSLLSAPNAAFPAMYVAQLNSGTKVVTMTPLSDDEDVAKVANVGPTFGSTTNLALTDPDSSTVVPWSAPRFAGTFELTSQGDQQQIYVRHEGNSHQSLTVLALTQSVDDTAWATTRSGRLFSTDVTADSVDVITGYFSSDVAYTVATPCGASSAPSVCSAADFLATLNPWTGDVTPVTVNGAAYNPKGGLLFVAGGEGRANMGGHGHDHRHGQGRW